MIRNEKEYQEAVQRLKQEAEDIQAESRRFAELGLAGEQLKRAIEPLISFKMQLEEEVESYEKLCRGDFGELTNLRGLGRLLIGIRIARGIKQNELAHRLGVDPSQVSRDERNEYHGITIDRAGRILEALDVTLTSTVELGAPVSLPPKKASHGA